MDVRDPYYTSPLIKLSPMQKLASQLANKYVDAVWLRTEPPIVYDANDPQFVLNGGPLIAPGAKVGTKSTASFQEIKIGEPEQALQGLTLIIQQLQQGLGVNSIRSGGGGDAMDKTATEIRTAEAKAEIRTAEFVAKQARQEKTSQVTAFASGDPGFSPLLNRIALLKEMYQDAGVKNPEKFLNVQQEQLPPEIEQARQEYEQKMAEHEQIISDLQKELAITKAVNEAKLQEASMMADVKMSVMEMEGRMKQMEHQMKMTEMSKKITMMDHKEPVTQ